MQDMFPSYTTQKKYDVLIYLHILKTSRQQPSLEVFKAFE